MISFEREKKYHLLEFNRYYFSNVTVPKVILKELMDYCYKFLFFLFLSFIFVFVLTINTSA